MLAVGLAFILATPAAPPRSFVIHADHRIGGYAVRADGTLGGALAEFGTPTRISRGRGAHRRTCEVVWRPLGLRMTFSNAARNPCASRWGYFAQAVLTGARWRTAKGLRIGDPERRLRVLYTPRRSAGRWWWLVVRYSPVATVHYGLEAKTMNGAVVAFRLNYTAGPD